MRKVLVAVLSVFFLANPGYAASLRWAAQNDILTLDPHSQNHATTHSIMQHTYEGLTRYTRDYKIEPCLAVSWKALSDTHWRFSLRKGVKFHDGSPFTADDVVFSFGRIKQPQGTNQVYVTGIKEVKKIDDYTVDFLLEGPTPILLRNIVDFRIMSKAWAEKNNSQNVQDYAKRQEIYASRNANGTGPYLIKSWEPDKRIVLAVDREAIRKVTMGGLSVPAGVMVAPGVHGYSKQIDLVTKYDVAGAKKLLAEAGYPDGFEFTLDCPNNRYVNDEKVCQALTAMWARAGLRVRLNSIPFANFIPTILNFDSSAYMLGWGVATFDGPHTLQSLVRTKTTGADGSFNLGRISDPKLDNTIDAIKIATDPAARDALLKEGLERTRDQAYYVPLHHQMPPWAMKKNVTIPYSPA